MTTTNEDGTAAATEKVGSMSLGDSAERKDDETEKSEAEENGTTPTKLCSACETKSDTLMKCRACKCVWYCDNKCQNKHWKEHKKECRLIKKRLDDRGGKLDLGEELDIGPLEKPPPREECPICMRALPLPQQLSSYSLCCGKTICCGCDFQHHLKCREQALPQTCAFCRTAPPESDEEILAQTRKRVELKDPEALFTNAMQHGIGDFGLPVDQAKCIDLLRQSAGLGFPDAQHNLGNFYHFGEMGLEKNEEEALKYWQKAAEGGDVVARHNLGSAANVNDDFAAAMHHWRLSASAGYRKSIRALIVCFEKGFLHHADLAETLQAMYHTRADMKSNDRDQLIVHFKEIGEYEEEYDM